MFKHHMDEREVCVGKQFVCSDTNCCDFRGGRPHDRVDWGGAAKINI